MGPVVTGVTASGVNSSWKPSLLYFGQAAMLKTVAPVASDFTKPQPSICHEFVMEPRPEQVKPIRWASAVSARRLIADQREALRERFPYSKLEVGQRTIFLSDLCQEWQEAGIIEHKVCG
jgi:hypothetical protein